MLSVRAVIRLLCFVAAGATAFATIVPNAPDQPNNDLWEFPAVVTSSPLLTQLGGTPINFDPSDVFGTYNSLNPLWQGINKGWIVFADRDSNGAPRPAGSMSWLEWSMAEAAPVTFSTVHLLAGGDYVANDIGPYRPLYRSISEFKLLVADSPGDWRTVADITNIQQPPNDWLRLAINLDAKVTANYFRAEFYSTMAGGGPRVIELEAYACPESGTAGLIGLGVVGVWLRLRRKRRV